MIFMIDLVLITHWVVSIFLFEFHILLIHQSVNTLVYSPRRPTTLVPHSSDDVIVLEELVV